LKLIRAESFPSEESESSINVDASHALHKKTVSTTGKRIKNNHTSSLI
jgi:hypothetical protein